MEFKSPITEGQNCWWCDDTERFAWLIDGDAYFTALRECMENAHQEIMIIGWDIDSRVSLIREEGHRHYPSPLAETLESLAEANDELRVYVLSWDFSIFFGLERELLPALRFDWQNHERLQFHLDNRHATGASHHQKLVVIDGDTAFLGGLDLTKSRWDTPDHAANDCRRVNIGGERYRPFHDVQAVVAGEAANELRKLAALRWENATGRKLQDINIHSSTKNAACWPSGLNFVAKNVKTALAKTWIPQKSENVYQEVERLYLDLIAAAEKYIYVENQYLTADSITKALCEKLSTPDGPEIVIVLPKSTAGWLEHATMETLRDRCIRRLRRADRESRLLIVAPYSAQLGEESINVHSKVMIVDDCWIRIGSSNLSARSMGLDSECDLVVEDDTGVLAHRMLLELLGEHLSWQMDEVKASISAMGLIATIEAAYRQKRCLRPIEVAEEDWRELLEPIGRVLDPEGPIERLSVLDPFAIDRRT